MSGSVFAVLTALAFALTSIFARRAVIKVPDASVGVLITVPLGVLFCMVALILTGQIRSVASLSWQSNAWLSAAGILHYVVGRSLNYNCVQLVGANIALSVSLLNPKRRAALVGIPGKAIGLFCMSGLLSSTANLLRFVALSLAPASVVHPLISIMPVFLLVLSFLFNRKLEVFNIPVIIGTGTVVIGSILLVY